MSRGHQFEAIVDGYPVALVLNLHKAMQENKRQAVLARAIGVSLGIRDALSEKGPLVKAWLQNEKAAAGKPPAERQEPLPPFLAGLPVVKKARRKNG